MKSTIIKAQAKKGEKFSPGLYIFKEGECQYGELIVYFNDGTINGYCSGLVVNSGNGRTIGDYRRDWIFVNFEKFNGVVELSNN